MKTDDDFFHMLDDYHKGLLSDRDARALHDRMSSDPEFRSEAEAYLQVMSTLKAFGSRKRLKETLESIHHKMGSADLREPSPPPINGFKKYWRLTTIAASVTVVAVVGTLLITQSLDTRQETYYKELRRDVLQIQESQKQILDGLAESKEKPIIPGRYSGTGFLISPAGYVATSYHVIKESDSVAIENDTYGRLQAKVVFGDPRHDISILKIISPAFKLKRSLPFTVSNNEADLGEYVYTLGFPREDIVFGEGSISAATGFRQDPNAYQVSVPVNPGNSGGPLLNSRGDLVGIVSGVQTETSGAAFAIKSVRLLELLSNEWTDTLKAPVVLPRKNSIAGYSRVQQVKRWKELVFMVRVYKGS